MKWSQSNGQRLSVLVVDVGLTQVKLAIFDSGGECLALSRAAYPTFCDETGRSRQNPEDWWRAMVSCAAELRETAGSAMDRLAGLTVTGHMHTLVLCDAHGSPLCSALTLADRSSQGSLESAQNCFTQAEFQRMSGTLPDPSLPLLKCHWLRRQLPALLGQSRHFLSCKDYLRMRLCGGYATDPLDACAFGGFDPAVGCWSEPLLEWAGLSVDQMPALQEPTAEAGCLKPQPASELGLQHGLPVFTGAGDDVEVLGFGLFEPGLAVEHFGTTGSVLLATARPHIDTSGSLETYPHLLPRQWLCGGSINHAASALSWVDRVLREDSANVSEDVVTAPSAAESLPVFSPHLTGRRSPNWNPAARGRWEGLMPSHEVKDLRLAARMGVAAALGAIVDAMRGSRLELREVRVTRPSSMDPAELTWLKQRAAFYGVPTTVVNQDQPTALGAAMLAMVGLGVYPTVAAAVQAVVRCECSISSDNEWSSFAEVYFRRYQEVNNA